MVDTTAVVIPAIKFAYKRYGAKGAVAAAIAVGATHAVITRVVPEFTDIDEEQVDNIYERIIEDDELADILGEEFNKRFGEYLDSETSE